MQPTSSQTLITQLPLVLTEKLGQITAFPSSNCEMQLRRREYAKTCGNQCYILPCRGHQGVTEAVQEVCAALKAAHTPTARTPALRDICQLLPSRSTHPGPSPSRGGSSRATPPARCLPRRTLPAGPHRPGARSQLWAVTPRSSAPPRRLPSPKALGVVKRRSGTDRKSVV